MGRPRAFDREAALDAAMRLFWRHGYEGVSIATLTRTMGIASPSLYAAFSSKPKLFDEALCRYETTVGSLDFTRLESAPDIGSGVRALLEDAVVRWTTRTDERGCMIWSGAIHVAKDHAPIAHSLRQRRDALRRRLAASLLRFVDSQEATRSSFGLSALLAGFSVQARDGLGAEEILSVLETGALVRAHQSVG